MPTNAHSSKNANFGMQIVFNLESEVIGPKSRRAVAQLARAAVSKTAGWGFKSLLP